MSGFRAVRPRPAASLVAIWTDSKNEPRVLMGKRRDELAFLPGVMVFPGGRLEGSDGKATGLQLSSDCHSALRSEGPKNSPNAFLHGALREAQEETGFDAFAFLSGPLLYIARAITPPHLPRRYDTRFFFSHVAPSAFAPPVGPGDGELVGSGWFSQTELLDHPIHHVTQAVLGHAFALVGGGLAVAPRLLVANRKPSRWTGAPPLRSAALKAGQQSG